MRTSTVMATIFGVGALASPHLNHALSHRLHLKREALPEAQPDRWNKWQEGNTVYVQHIKEVTAVAAAPEQTGQQVAANIKYGGKFQNKNNFRYQRRPANDNAAAPVQTPAAKPIEKEATVDPPKSVVPESSTPAAPASVGGSVQGPEKPWTSDAASPIGNGESRNILAATNAWRRQWNPSLTDYTWSDVLAKNAWTTADSPVTINAKGDKENENKGTEMNHALYPGSHGQCIAGGTNSEAGAKKVNETYTASPYELGLLGWLCELPNDNIKEGCALVGNVKNIGKNPTGHAEILQSPSKSFGVIFMGTMFTADFT